MYILARITKLFRPKFKKTLVSAKPRYRPRLNLIEHQLLNPRFNFED